ncbi:MAG: head fiber protein [Peptostreptococcaceae bacterium]
MSGLSNFTNNFLNKVLVAPVNINDLDEARRVQLPAGLKVFVAKGLRYGATEEHAIAPTGSKYTHLHSNVYFLDLTEDIAGYLRVHSDKSVPLGDARMNFSITDTSARASSSIHGDINITKDGLDIKSNYTVNVVINEDDIGDGYYRVFTGSGRKRLLEVGDRVFKYGEQGYDIYHTGNKPSKADVGLGKVENLTRAEILAGYTNTTDLNSALATKLGKNERAVDSALLEGDNKATVIANARNGLAPNTLATTTAHGLMSKDDKVKLNGLSNYTLPTASTSVLGGVKIGANIGISGGVISVAQASASTLGVVKIGSTLTITAQGVVEVNTGTIGTKGYIDSKIAELVGSAPEYLNTLEELATAIESSGSTIDSLLTQMGNKVDKVTGKQLSTNDFTNAYKDKVDSLNNYSHPSGAGNQHIPAGGAANQFLKWSSNGVAVWGTVDWSMIGSKPSIFPTNWDNVAGKPSTFTPTSHTHDYIVATDKRDVKPNTTGIGATVKGIKPFFASINGMNGATGGGYGDLLVMDTYTDTSGGSINALFFEKGAKRIKHYQAGQAATAWGTPHDLAYLTDITWGNLAGKVEATTSVPGLMSAADKNKINGIASGANNYVHPNDANTRHVTDAEKNIWNSSMIGGGNTNDLLGTITGVLSRTGAVHSDQALEDAGLYKWGAHITGCGSNAAVQIYAPHSGIESGKLYFRHRWEGTISPWQEIWHTGNLDVSTFLRSNARQVISTASGGTSWSDAQLEINSGGDGSVSLSMHRPGHSHVALIHDAPNVLKVNMNSGTHTIYHTGNVDVGYIHRSLQEVAGGGHYLIADRHDGWTTRLYMAYGGLGERNNSVQVSYADSSWSSGRTRGDSGGGSHAAWRDRDTIVQVDCPHSGGSASNVWRATNWGSHHIAACDVYDECIRWVIHTDQAMTFNRHGHLSASVVWNAVWNDYAEYFPKKKGYVTEAGDIIALSMEDDTEVYELATEDHFVIVGAHSDFYGHIIGGEKLPDGYQGTFEEYNAEKFIPVGMVGRIPVKFKGVAKKGMKVVPSDEPGVGRAFDRTKDDYDKVIGYIVENNDEEGVRRVKIKIGK